MSKFVDALSSDPGSAIGALAILVGCLTGIIITAIFLVSDAWRKVRETEDNNVMKQQMLEKGMTAEEVATVIDAKPGRKT